MKKQIIALGGGGFLEEPENPLLDKYILKQSDKPNPKVCFIGTASADSEEYIVKFYTAFLKLKCIPTHLSLYRPPTTDLEAFVLDQDVFYVGGGNTRCMLALWREWKLDVYLRAAWENGKILAGISAGSICWFEEGLSDFLPNELNKLKCLGFLEGSNTPHYDGEENRRPAYHKLILNGEMSEGVAADDGVALHYIGRELKNVVSSRPDAKAYFVRKKLNKIEEESIAAFYLAEDVK